MSLRITGGMARGRVLRGTLPNGVRPTSSRVREAWFSILGNDLTGLQFLDAYAGSGIMGFEAWSRGASSVLCVENRIGVARQIRENSDLLGANIQVKVGDACRLSRGAFDLIFADPPYAKNPIPIIQALATQQPMVLGIETRRGVVVADLPGAIRRTRSFGKTELHIYRWSQG